MDSSGGGMMTEQVMKIHAVVVTYNPELDVLRRELELVIPQVDKIWLVDNASTSSLLDWVNGVGLQEKLALVQMRFNLGLGAAQNAGIKMAREAGATHVLILDQDSQPMSDMVDRLLAACNQFQSLGLPVAAVAPVYEDKKTGTRSGFVTLGWLDYKKQFVSPEQAPVEVDFVISSGSLIPMSALNEIGLIDEELFIDHVDTEWCMRALSKGFKLFGVPSARMFHSLGDKRKRVWFLRWRNVPYHSPFRYYYMLRNGVLLRKRSYIPLKWRIGEFMRSWQMLVFFGFWGEGSFKRLGMMLRGLVDGYKGVHGPMPTRHD
jgi:rhamnosyltransferase